MKQLALAVVAILMVTVASDVTFARGGAGGYHGGARGSGSTGGSHGGGGYTGGKPAANHGGESQGDRYTTRWHGGRWYGGWHGAGLGIYVGDPAYWGSWSYAYYGTYPGYYAYPVHASDATTVYAESAQQAMPAYYWYYCANPAGYYPYIQDCNDSWLTVIPQR